MSDTAPSASRFARLRGHWPRVRRWVFRAALVVLLAPVAISLSFNFLQPPTTAVILRRKHMKALSPSWLPFADAASEGLPLHQLLRLSLFQISVGMATVLLLGTLNRVMIVEMGVPASVVAIMIALPVLIAPFRALLGYRSDTYRSALGWRRMRRRKI